MTIDRVAESEDRRRFRELMDRSSLGPITERHCPMVEHRVSDAARRAADQDLIDRSRCLGCGAKVHLERRYMHGVLYSEFWEEGWQ